MEDFQTYPGVTGWLIAHDPAAALLLAGAEAVAADGAAGTGARADVCLPVVRSADPELVVPAGDLGYDLGADRVLAHAFVSAVAYDVLARTGRVGPDGMLVRRWDSMFVPAYDWLRWQMARRVAGYGGRYPMWMWVRQPRKELVDEVRWHATHSPGSVLLTLRVPREKMLVTDFDDWHSVLNGTATGPVVCLRCGAVRCQDRVCLGRTYDVWADGWAAREPRAADGRVEPWWRWPVSLRDELFRTWEEVLDVRRSRYVQACVEVVHAGWVVDAVRL